jgi:hypothetical protein
MPRIKPRPAGFRRGLIAISVPMLCVACGQARVDYAKVDAAAGQAGDIDAFRDPGIRFRIPRSLIKVSTIPSPAPTNSGGGAISPAGHAPVAAPAQPAFAAEAIDPISTGPTPIQFPNNPGLGYTVDLTPDTSGVVSRDAFIAQGATASLKIVPVPQCVQANVGIYQIDGRPPSISGGSLQAVAAPSEFEIPNSIHQTSTVLSPLYTAKPRNDALSTTTLNVSYLGDSRIMQSVGSTVTDNTKATIDAVAGVAGAFVKGGLAPLKPQAVPQPVRITTFSLTVADNRWVQPITIPPSGTVTFHTCTADTTIKTDATPATTAFLADLTEAMTQAKNIYGSSKQ